MDSNDFFIGASEDSDCVIANNLHNFIGLFHWAAEFGLFASLIG